MLQHGRPWRRYVKQKKPVIEHHLLCDSIYEKCPEKENLYRQK